MHMNIRINIVKIDKMVYNIYRGDIMQIIDQMIAEIVNLFIDFLSKYWLLGTMTFSMHGCWRCR